MTQINIQELSARIRSRLNDDKDEIVADEFTVVSETTGNPVQDSINRALTKTGTSTPNQTLIPSSGIPQNILEQEATISAAPEATPFEKLKRALPRHLREGLFGSGQTIERPNGEIYSDKGLLGFLYGGLTEGDTEQFMELDKDLRDAGVDDERAAQVAFDITAGAEVELTDTEQSVVRKAAVFNVVEKGVDLLDFVSFGLAGRVGDVVVQATKAISKTDDVAQVATELKNINVPESQIDNLAKELAQTTDAATISRRIDETFKAARGTDEASEQIAKGLDEAVQKNGSPIRSITDDGGDSFRIEFQNRQDPLLLDKKIADETFGIKSVDQLDDIAKKSGARVEIPTFQEAKKLIAKEGGFANASSLAAKNAYAAEELAGSFNLNGKFLYDNATSREIDLAAELQKIDGIEDAAERASAATSLVNKVTDSTGRVFKRTGNQFTAPVEPVRRATLSKAPKYTRAEKKTLDGVNNAPSFKSPAQPPANGQSKEVVKEYRDNRGKVAKMKDSILEQIQDDMVRVRRLVNDKNLKITDQSNPYDAEIAFHGRVGTRIEELRDTADAIDANIVKKAKKAKISPEQMTKEVNEYLVARHAPERNAALGDGAAGITTDAAKARMAELDNLPYANDLKEAAEEIQKLNNQTLDILKEGEVITDDLYKLLREKYKNHIPLQRIMDVEDDFVGAMARGFDVKGTGIKTAKGSEREVADVLGNVVYNFEQAVIRAEKNRVDLATLKMVRDNKEALRGLFKVRKPRVVGQTWSGKPITEQITDPSILVMREKGEVRLIEIGDENLAVALRGVGRQKFSGMMRGVAAVSRFYSGIHTRFNPEFAFSNKIRDIQEVLVYTAAQGELGTKGTLKVAAREARLQNVAAVTDFLRGKNSEGARMYKQMRADGGTTGGLGLSTRKQIELDIAEIRKLNRSKPHRAAQKTVEYIDKWNQIFEDSSRLSVYREAIANGATRQRAAVLAKESSVNFNKFGRQGSIINGLYMFANASIQGSTKTLRAMKDPKVAATVTTTVFGSVYAISEWNDQIDSDWRNKIREWDRLNSLAIMLPSSTEGDVKYITVPVAWGIKPIKVMADEMVDLAAGKSEGLASASASVLTSILEAYNPAGGSDVMQSVTPTILDIPLDVARNQAWHGGNIKPDWDRNAPASIQYFDSLRDSTSGRTAVAVSKGLSGIGIEISPADIHYSYQQLIGGAGRTADKVITTLSAIGGNELLVRDIPVVSRFYKSIPDEEVGSGASEFQKITEVLEEQSRERFYLNQQAEDSYQQLKNLPQQEAASMFEEIRKQDPDLAKEIAKVKKDDDKGLTFIDRKILQLGVGNGQRAAFLVDKFNELETTEEKAQLWTEYRSKGIISDTVAEQLKELLAEQED